LDAVTAEREAGFRDDLNDSRKRLDIVVTDSTFVLGIENKVYAPAGNNRFPVYDQLLEFRADGGPILKCVLRPHPPDDDVHLGWPVITYTELVDKALAQFGPVVALTPVTKWQFFYREFLLHLQLLSKPFEQTVMNEANLKLAIENCSHLKRAMELLQDFEKVLQQEALVRVKVALISLGINTDVGQEKSTLPAHNAYYLGFLPRAWGEDSQVALSFMEDETDEGQVGFYIYAYVPLETAKRDLAQGRALFEEQTNREDHPWAAGASEALTWEEGKQGESASHYVCFGAWPKPYSKDGAMERSRRRQSGCSRTLSRRRPQRHANGSGARNLHPPGNPMCSPRVSRSIATSAAVASAPRRPSHHAAGVARTQLGHRSRASRVIVAERKNTSGGHARAWIMHGPRTWASAVITPCAPGRTRPG
jgi:hypothetical protein